MKYSNSGNQEKIKRNQWKIHLSSAYYKGLMKSIRWAFLCFIEFTEENSYLGKIYLRMDLCVCVCVCVYIYIRGGHR